MRCFVALAGLGVCMRDSVCQPTLSGCVGVARIDLLQIAGRSSLIAAPDAGLCFRGRRPREDTAVSRLIKPTLIPIITCTKLSSDSQCNSLVLCRQSPVEKGDSQYEGKCALGVYYLLDWFWLSACEACRPDGCRVCIHTRAFLFDFRKSAECASVRDMVHVTCCNWFKLNLSSTDDVYGQVIFQNEIDIVKSAIWIKNMCCRFQSEPCVFIYTCQWVTRYCQHKVWWFNVWKWRN